jgi:tetratricopeptide (TPR) repeat protein
MKWLSLTIAAFLTAFAFAAFTSIKTAKTTEFLPRKKAGTISCVPDRNWLNKFLEGEDIPLMPGSGTYHWKLSTSSDSAQLYFDQGINMYYGFHIIEALASFKKAARFDPQNPMVWWAQALALGPNINDVGYAASPDALAFTQKAKDLSAAATPLEKMLIYAMSVRYSKDSTQSREKLNQDYVDEMNKASRQYASNADAAALYADALMLQHPWDLWYNNGTPKPWTPRIREVLEKLLAKTPTHPGANHYYIHVMEASPYAGKALPSADRLGKLTPGLSHLVHMPSHIYLRVGQFNKGTEVNEEAVKQYATYNELFSPVTENAFLYQWHNLHMQANCAMLAGRYEYAQKTAVDLQKAIDTSLLSLPPPMGSAVQYLYMTPVFLNIRYAKWSDLLAMPAPISHHVYATILYHFGKGMAYAALKDFDSAEKEKSEIENLMDNPSLTIPIKPFSPPIEGVKCARDLLSGFIHYKQNKLAEAIIYFNQAAETERNMTYNEPRDWLLSPKQWLGTALMTAGRWSEAQKAFEKDLLVNNNNVWSLYGLHQSLTRQNKQSKAANVKAQFLKASSKSDVKMETMF